MDYGSDPDHLEPCLPQLGSQKCRSTRCRCGHSRISPARPSPKGNRRNLLAMLSRPASRSRCILQQYQQTLPKGTHGSRAQAMAQHLETTSSLQRVLTALIPSTITFVLSQILDFAPLNWIVVLAALTGGWAHWSTIRRLRCRQCSSI